MGWDETGDIPRKRTEARPFPKEVHQLPNTQMLEIKVTACDKTMHLFKQGHLGPLEPMLRKDNFYGNKMKPGRFDPANVRRLQGTHVVKLEYRPIEFWDKVKDEPVYGNTRVFWTTAMIYNRALTDNLLSFTK